MRKTLITIAILTSLALQGCNTAWFNAYTADAEGNVLSETNAGRVSFLLDWNVDDFRATSPAGWTVEFGEYRGLTSEQLGKLADILEKVTLLP